MAIRNALALRPHGEAEQLIQRWVGWAASFGTRRHPISDRSGRRAHRGQTHEMFFLAGTFGGAVTRNCTVPQGLPIFFPLINMWVPAQRDIPMLDRATGEAVLDGDQLEGLAVGSSEAFPVRGAFGNPVTGSWAKAIMRCWGLWILCDPLPAGAHELAFHGSDGHGFTVAANYHLTVGSPTRLG